MLLFFFSSCKKYEEGPLISFRTKQHRIEGKWQLTSLIKGRELIGTWLSTFHLVQCTSGFVIPSEDLYQRESETWEFTKDKINISTVWVYKDIDEAYSRKECEVFYLAEYKRTSSSSDTWEFDNKKENVIITDFSGEKSYEIIELKEKEMKLKLTEKGDITTYTFKTLE